MDSTITCNLLSQVANRWSERSRELLAGDWTVTRTAWLHAMQASETLYAAAKKVKEADLVAEINVPVVVKTAAEAAMDALWNAIDADEQATKAWDAYQTKKLETGNTPLDAA